MREHFPNGFGDTRPFTFAPTCNSGNYEGSSDNGVAEAFYDAHGAVYIGSTEISYRNLNINAIRGFLSRWDEIDSVGDAFMDLERDQWGEDSDWRYWIREYNLYGDPKFGAALQPGLAASAGTTDAPTETLTLDLPALVVTSTTASTT